MSLRSFLEHLEAKGEVLHVKDEVSTCFEISCITEELLSQGLVLFFEKIKDHSMKIVTNVCGTRDRICEALDVGQNHLHNRLLEAWRSPRKPEIVKDGPVKEVIERPDLSKIPVLTHFEKDGGPYITSAVIHAESVDGKVGNVSIHRLQVLDKSHLAIRLVPRHLHRLWQMSKDADRDLDIAISIGVHPAVMLAASSPVSFGVNEFDVANVLMENKLRLVKCRHVNAYAPADAELVLEGKISATNEVVEGPFVDITGTYDVERKQPVVEVVGIMRRQDCIYEAVLPSRTEHKLLMGLPREVLIWDSVSKVVPKVNAVNLSSGGCGWLHAVISVEKQLEGDGKNALLAAFAAHPSLKHAVVVDSDVNVHDSSDVEWAIATRFQAGKDLIIIENARGSTLDSSSDQETGLTSKMGIDSTRPLSRGEEKFERAVIPMTERIQELVEKLSGS